MFRSFLNDLDRIASRDYVVTDDDVVRARLRTVGIQEHSLFFGSGPWDVSRCTSTASCRFVHTNGPQQLEGAGNGAFSMWGAAEPL